MNDEGNDSGTPQLTTPRKQVVVSMDRFSTIPRRRRRYVALYLAMMAMWVATTVVGVRTQARNEEAAKAAAEETALEDESAVASEEEEAAEPAEADFAETTRALLEQRPIIFLQVATGACMVIFYLNFIGVLRTMGYPAILILVICLGCFFPLPGLLVVAMVDRRVSKVWHDANPDPV